MLFTIITIIIFITQLCYSLNQLPEMSFKITSNSFPSHQKLVL